MKAKTGIATLILFGAIPLAAIGADYGSSSSSNPSSQSGMSSGAQGTAGSSRDESMSGSSTTGSTASSDTSATGQPASVPRQFRRLDKNKDGFIEKSEAKRSKDLANNFDQYDTDHDGKLSLSEWQAAHGMAGVAGSSRRGTTDSSSGAYGSGSTGGSSGSMGGSSSGGSMGGSSSGGGMGGSSGGSSSGGGQ